MRDPGVRRSVRVSGAGVDGPGDQRSLRDRVVCAPVQRLGGEVLRDEALEREVCASSGLARTLVRVPRLVDRARMGQVEHHADRSPSRTSITRAELATVLADLVARLDCVQQAPLVAGT